VRASNSEGGEFHAIQNKIRRTVCARHGNILRAVHRLRLVALWKITAHHGLFELIPGFVWGNPVSMVWGAVYMGVLEWIAGWYIAWMHNASIVTAEK
jgi:hypothetical protein